MEPRDEPPPYDVIAFDCDSTLSAIEGIDELGTGLDRTARTEMLGLTRRAMAGELALEAVYARRLALVRPSRARLAEVGALYVERVQPGARELCAALARLGKRVLVVSGGLRDAVLPLARHLGLPPEDVFAVPLEFDERGEYAGFDAGSPLARAGGKPELLGRLLAQGGAFPGAAAALVGDGATDLEARPVLARFVAYGGVVARASVMEGAAVRCETADFAGLVPLLLAPDERALLSRDPDHAALMRRAERLAAPQTS